VTSNREEFISLKAFNFKQNRNHPSSMICSKIRKQALVGHDLRDSIPLYNKSGFPLSLFIFFAMHEMYYKNYIKYKIDFI